MRQDIQVILNGPALLVDYTKGAIQRHSMHNFAAIMAIMRQSP